MFSLNDVLQDADKKAAETPKVAQEAINVEVEREFCMWAEVDYDEQERLINDESYHYHYYVDFLLKSDEQRRRVRITEQGGTYTVKLMNDDGSRTEENTDLSVASALLFHHDAKLTHVVCRLRKDEPSIAGGQWDIDMFVNNIGYDKNIFKSVPNFKEFLDTLIESATYGNLIKVELEMKEKFESGMSLDQLKELSGINCEQYWASGNQDPDVRTLLDNYWYNVTDF